MQYIVQSLILYQYGRTFLYSFSSNVSGRINCGIAGAGGTIGAATFSGLSGGSAEVPPGSNAELVDGPSFVGAASQWAVDDRLLLCWAPIVYVVAVLLLLLLELA